LLQWTFLWLQAHSSSRRSPQQRSWEILLRQHGLRSSSNFRKLDLHSPITLRRWPPWLTNYCCVRVADTFDAFFFTYEAFTGYCSANRKVSINEIGFCDNELGFCVQTLDVLFGVTFVNIIKFAFGASSTITCSGDAAMALPSRGHQPGASRGT
jgi:hypothetical protein